MPVVGGYKELLAEIEKLARSKPAREYWENAFKDFKFTKTETKTETKGDRGV